MGDRKEVMESTRIFVCLNVEQVERGEHMKMNGLLILDESLRDGHASMFTFSLFTSDFHIITKRNAHRIAREIVANQAFSDWL